MAASYPGGLYSPRTKANRAGAVYDAGKTTITYAEDVIKLDEEVVAIETELGTDPKGTSTDVAAKIKGFKSQATADADAIQIKDGKNVGIDTATPTQILSIKEKVGFTSIGGNIIKLTNKTGAPSVKGELVECSIAVDDAVQLSSANSLEPIGVFLESGVADGDEAWIVEGGIAEVKADGVGWVKGDWINSSAVGGRCEGSAHVPNPAKHMQEVGHALGDAAGNGLAKVVLHFN